MVPNRATIVAVQQNPDGTWRYRVTCRCDDLNKIAYDVNVTAAEKTAANTDALLASLVQGKCPATVNGVAFPTVQTPGTGIAPTQASLPAMANEGIAIENSISTQA